MTEHTPTTLIERACRYAWGPTPVIPWGRIVASPPRPPRTEVDDRILGVTMVMDDLMKKVGPKMDRDDGLQLACLLFDIGLAVHNGRRFLPGVLRKTPGIEGMATDAIMALVNRHTRGDWGDITDDDRTANEVALAGNGRLLSCYRDVRDGELFWVRVWVLTDPSIVAAEGDPEDLTSRLRPSTLILLPSEY
jgi:hypothetical protein